MAVEVGAGPLWWTQVFQLSECPPGRRRSATQPLLFLDALEESPSDHLDPPAGGSCIRREDSRDLPGHTVAVRRHGTLSRPYCDLLTCGFSPG